MLKNLNLSLIGNYSTDPVTGTLDRTNFLMELANIIDNRKKNDRYIFGLSNIEHFKLINHSHSHQAGDYVLNMVAKTLSLEMDDKTIIGRVGNDEFGFICHGKKVAQLQSACEALNYSLSHAPVSWNGKKIRLHIKFALVVIDTNIESVDQLLRYANEAIYSAYYDGCSTVCEHNVNDTAILRRSSKMNQAIKLQRWIAHDHFLLYVQPIVYLSSPRKASHFELLLRGRSDAGKVISPGKLIDAAEDFNLTPMLDKWVIRNLFEWINRSRNTACSEYKFSFNLSALSINDSELSNYIIDLAKHNNVNPRKINIEITERVAISNMKRCFDFMMKLKKAGFSFSLDDFGAGYCSFKYIQTLPFDVIKIDGSFIKDIDSNLHNRTITKAITDIARAYNKQTVAEFIENSDIARVAREIGIDYGQGFYFSRPHCITKLSDS